MSNLSPAAKAQLKDEARRRGISTPGGIYRLLKSAVRSEGKGKEREGEGDSATAEPTADDVLDVYWKAVATQAFEQNQHLMADIGEQLRQAVPDELLTEAMKVVERVVRRDAVSLARMSAPAHRAEILRAHALGGTAQITKQAQAGELRDRLGIAPAVSTFLSEAADNSLDTQIPAIYPAGTTTTLMTIVRKGLPGNARQLDDYAAAHGSDATDEAEEGITLATEDGEFVDVATGKQALPLTFDAMWSSRAEPGWTQYRNFARRKDARSAKIEFLGAATEYADNFAGGHPATTARHVAICARFINGNAAAPVGVGDELRAQIGLEFGPDDFAPIVDAVTATLREDYSTFLLELRRLREAREQLQPGQPG